VSTPKQRYGRIAPYAIALSQTDIVEQSKWMAVRDLMHPAHQPER
jgi:hypothetical protein